MKEHPILFSTKMVRAILDGVKTQTRRPIPVLPKEKGQKVVRVAGQNKCYFVSELKNTYYKISDPFKCPYEIGDHLWVRETWQGPLLDTEADPDWHYHSEKYENPDYCVYKADGAAAPEYVDLDDEIRQGWRPSIHMPRWASRITLLVKSVRTEPLHNISDADAIREGIYKGFSRGPECALPIATDWDDHEKVLVAGVPRLDFEKLWRRLYPEGPKSWGSNPWVWVIDFEVVK